MNVLDNSPLFNENLGVDRRMTVPEGLYMNGQHRNWLLYMLRDGMYPTRGILVLPVHATSNVRYSHMIKLQKGIRKDFERFFGCLQGRIKILRQEQHEWSAAGIILIRDV